MLADVGPPALDTPADNLPVLASLRPADTRRSALLAAVLILEVHANTSATARPLALAILAVKSGSTCTNLQGHTNLEKQATTVKWEW